MKLFTALLSLATLSYTAAWTTASNQSFRSTTMQFRAATKRCPEFRETPSVNRVE